MFGLQAISLGRETRAARDYFLKAAAGFLFSKVMGQLVTNLCERTQNVCRRCVAVRSAALQNCRASKPQHGVQASMLSHEVLDIRVLFVVVRHGLLLSR